MSAKTHRSIETLVADARSSSNLQVYRVLGSLFFPARDRHLDPKISASQSRLRVRSRPRARACLICILFVSRQEAANARCEHRMLAHQNKELKRGHLVHETSLQSTLQQKQQSWRLHCQCSGSFPSCPLWSHLICACMHSRHHDLHHHIASSWDGQVARVFVCEHTNAGSAEGLITLAHCCAIAVGSISMRFTTPRCFHDLYEALVHKQRAMRPRTKQTTHS